MSNESKTTKRNGVGFTGLLTLVFITLKLTNYIDWSWWWVLSPLWIGVAVFLLILAIGIIAIAATHEDNSPKKSNFQERLEEMAKQRRGEK